MAEQRLLSELCSICNSNAPKYRCPRDAVRTCSMACHRRHKQWAQCSGERDPAAYVKKSELATPAGIDRDFNFLTGIERAIERREREAEEREESLRGGRQVRAGFAPVPGSKYWRRLKDAGVVVDRAPKGMSRQRQNRTRYLNRSQCICWTIEWVHPDQSKTIDEIKDTTPLSDEYDALVKRMEKKRKREDEAVKKESTVVSPTPETSKQVKADSSQKELDKTLDQNSKAQSTFIPATRSTSETELQNVANLDGQSNPDGNIQTDTANDAQPSADFGAQTMSAEIKTESIGSTQQYHFYLVKPHTATAKHVLIPLPRQGTLDKCLRHQVVLEFPTIQVLRESPDRIPEAFMLEAEYVGKEKEDETEFKQLVSGVAVPSTDEVPDDGKVDDRKIIEVLQQDLSNSASQ
ncbi:hypothetical protein BDY21DRAFT_369202 [Lineolata rhizophorae]|uniref:HIT-type domain-containing protein n=1 Tax=Lineolata rhizophorae TaxID=578093 RepID=A0A6A6PBB8_9PEZI|nr:hypothetical protein BDY21DRAFT_369202 [Lineolata rhizophorae]